MTELLAPTEPAERLADRLVSLRELEPPVDVQGLIDEVAETVQVDVPYDIDADAIAIIDPSSKARSRILLNSRRPAARQRFTLAHELGHILIPWHLGSIACTVKPYAERASSTYTAFEWEANRFASRLLLPRTWLAGIVAGATTVAEMLDALAVAEVSAAAGLLALREALPRGYVLALIDATGHVEMSIRSDGTLAPVLPTGSRLDAAAGLNTVAAEFSTERHQNRTIAWWRFADRVPIEVSEVSPGRLKESARIMEDAILKRAGLTEHRASFSGVVGYANTAASQSPEGIAAAILQRLASRPEFGSVMNDPEFSEWLSLKAALFASRPAQRRSRT